MSKTRQCANCKACCDGTLGADVYGQPIDRQKGCYFLDKLEVSGCSIYKDRPPVCTNYRCGYLLGYVPEEYRPYDCGLLIDTRRNEILRVFILRSDYNEEAYDWAVEYAKNNNLKFKKYISIKQA